MSLYLYNTMNRKTELFTSIEPNKVKIYTCGPTVYNFIHIGNARMTVVFDTLRRYLRYLNYDVTFVQNLTDVDDRIINESKKQNRPEVEISSKYIGEYNRDLKSLNVLMPDVQPKVTEHIPIIIEFIQKLIQKEFAYEIQGDVYFDVKSFPSYGKLTNQSLSNLQHTEREIAHTVDYKRNEFDFALWKAQKNDEIAWDSPWGKGRPGWHIECSVMSMNYLGDTFDIHGGGLDLCFPHHENEIVQSEALSGKTFSNYWMHNNYVTVNGQKMSKSLGNFTTVRDVLKKYNGETIRFFFLSTNYRNTIDYSEISLQQAELNLNKIKSTFHNLKQSINLSITNNIDEYSVNVIKSFEEFMNNDLDTANVITLLIEVNKKANIMIDSNQISESVYNSFLHIYLTINKVLGFTFTQQEEIIEDKIIALIDKRNNIKELVKTVQTKEEKIKLFNEADTIRNSLKRQGILLEDTSNGTRWKREK